MDLRKFNLTELIMAMSNSGWVSDKISFNPAEWNSFSYYRARDVKISIKIIGTDLILRRDFKNGLIQKIAWDNIFEYFFNFEPDCLLINKAQRFERKLDKMNEDFE